MYLISLQTVDGSNPSHVFFIFHPNTLSLSLSLSPFLLTNIKEKLIKMRTGKVEIFLLVGFVIGIPQLCLSFSCYILSVIDWSSTIGSLSLNAQRVVTGGDSECANAICFTLGGDPYFYHDREFLIVVSFCCDSNFRT